MSTKTKEVFDDVSDMAGINVAIKLFERFEGSLVHITGTTSPFCKALRQLSDKHTVIDFLDKYDRKQLYIGKVKNLLREIRNREIIKRYDGGNIKDLVREFNLSEAMIGKIVKEKRQGFIKQNT